MACGYGPFKEFSTSHRTATWCKFVNVVRCFLYIYIYTFECVKHLGYRIISSLPNVFITWSFDMVDVVLCT